MSRANSFEFTRFSDTHIRVDYRYIFSITADGRIEIGMPFDELAKIARGPKTERRALAVLAMNILALREALGVSA